MLPLINKLLFETQSALINAVAPELRAVTVELDIKNKAVCFFFFYSGQVTDELFELASLVVTDVEFYPLEYRSRFQTISIAFPEKIPIQGRLAFLRKEPTLPEYKKESRSFLLKETLPIVVLLLDMQEALLGKVTPELRQVSMEIKPEEQYLAFYFIYDGAISAENYNLAASAIGEACVSFPEYKVDAHIERVDSPKETPVRGQRTAYLRQEWKW